MMYQIWYDFVKRQESCGPNTKPCQNPYKFDMGSKGQCRIGIMEIDPCAKYDMPVPWDRHEEMSKLYKFDLEVKDQRHIRIMNVRDTLSHSDTPMSQIRYSYAGQESADRRTDQTDRLIDSYVPPFYSLQGV